MKFKYFKYILFSIIFFLLLTIVIFFFNGSLYYLNPKITLQLLYQGINLYRMYLPNSITFRFLGIGPHFSTEIDFLWLVETNAGLNTDIDFKIN